VDHSERSTTSTPGASWIFTLDELRSSGAFLATAMNGERLPPDHGYPVRLFVPGWYGCASIKWVNEISLVDHEAPSTPQMREFGPRTFQNGRPALAREYKPATMDLAAMPVRVERWVGTGGPVYRVVGVMWGGDAPVDRLSIRFNPREPFVPIAVCPKPVSADSWSLWSHIWRPMERGRYRIVLKAGDPAVRTERLDTYYYTRELYIDEV
jgi:DMSO/TMAO reductase YedYZ molybdopterin-dependent catalytic subunit